MLNATLLIVIIGLQTNEFKCVDECNVVCFIMLYVLLCISVYEIKNFGISIYYDN